METIKDENGKEIIVELVLVKNKSTLPSCIMCIINSDMSGCNTECNKLGYFINKKNLT